ncbi:TPA: hypothetical protein N0F65_003684, partial [Lagenidium giganteum]
YVNFSDDNGTDLADESMAYAFQHGINFFDNAEYYGKGKSEEIMGHVVRRGIRDGVWMRDDLVLSTKIFLGTKAGPNANGLSRKHIIEGTKASLQRLQVDYVDVLFCHRPDPRTPIEETVRAMNHVIEQDGRRLGLIRPVAEQPQYNILERSRVEFDYVNLFKKYKLGVTTWSPLAFGVLTGKYANGILGGSRLSQSYHASLVKDLAGRVAKVNELMPIADELGCTMAQLAIAWCASNPNVSTVILGASSLRQLQENLQALEVVDGLTPEIKQRIDAIVRFVPKIPVVEPRVVAMREMYLEESAKQNFVTHEQPFHS